MKARCLLVAALFVASGCESNPSGAPASSAAPVATTASASVATPAPAAPVDLGGSYKDEQLPVPGDFEDMAAKAVTKENYTAKLAELDAAVGGGPEASASPAASSSAPATSAAPRASVPAPPAPAP